MDGASAGELAPADGWSLDPLAVTFRGGGAEPLHRWFPLLEGYSPAFVRRVLGEIAPGAHRVLDPFGGSGTTPLTVARAGGEALYCEVNPVLAHLIEAKGIALATAERRRRDLAERLEAWGSELPWAMKAAAPDRALDAAYARAFGDSRYFEPPVYDSVLSLRAVLDALEERDPDAARFATIAALAALLPASRLVRRGDVRFKNEAELAEPTMELLDGVRAALERISADLRRIETIARRPVFVVDDARKLARLPPLELDAVVTSPPYLNGTNYFRNTKVELWFLRCLAGPADLAAYRRLAVTGGINDVTRAKLGEVPARFAPLVERLDASAYDPRIPRMLVGYVRDLEAVFRAVAMHLVRGGRVAIDIRDSCYGGVHVPTDAIVRDVLLDVGLVLEREIVLRRRMSRGGAPLRQSLLVFRRDRTRARTGEGPRVPRWQRAWEAFRSELPHQRGERKKRNWGHPLHSVCSYQGKMKPSLAASLVATFVPKGGTMLDPFAGVGTIPFEAALAGVRSHAFDVSPAALAIARAKLGRAERTACERILVELEHALARGRSTDAERTAASRIAFNGPLASYFHPRTLDEVLVARRFFRAREVEGPSEALVLASLLHVLHGNRPYALSRRSHPVTPFAPTGPVEHRPLVPRLRAKVERCLAAELPVGFVEGSVHAQDATALWPRSIDHLDAIVTSPPFYDSTRFHLGNWMRLWFAGWEADDFRTRPSRFIDERQKSSFEVYDALLRQGRERLRDGAPFVLHLGKSAKCDMAEALAARARRWFRVADVFAEDVAHCESHGIRDKGAVRAHQYLVLV